MRTKSYNVILNYLISAIGAGLVLLLMFLPACQHGPTFIDDDMMPTDTTIVDPGDTTVVNPGDTTIMLGPCDPDIVYFDLDILPILKSNCAFSGCHDAASAQDGVILESYETTIQTADVEPFNLDDSEIYEVLVDDEEEERMPPPPTARLSPSQIQLIAKWILQGGENLSCDPDLSLCDTMNVSFAEFVQPTINNHCLGCHSGNVPAGGLDFSTYAGIKDVALNGRLYGAVARLSGFSAMPRNSNPLPQCTVDKIKSWIDQGALNN